ncbi:hypothetical protein MML48_1g04604 [Holotrichia oblita]|uniref:Uncharacterized protein n=1 Tax=Holotrichia oblita TaxID=644536 RepID=A0ACB9TW63_HOLOL|nr:hypothetical protein MML48_1g04604 [Holotrichia oblita]
MADDGDWFAASDDAPPAEPTSLLKKSAADSAAGEEVEIIEEVVEEDGRPEAEGEALDPDKLILCKHWIRPKFLQYTYLYDYRHNYYNDVLDFLDKRQKGLSRDTPRAQTWAERALRTYNSKINRSNYYRNQQEDTKLCTKIRLGSLFHIYHSKEYFNRRYATLL